MTTSVLIIALASSLATGQTAASQTPPVVKACSLLSKAEVKKLIGGSSAFDSVEPKEASSTNGLGSSCKYAGAFVQVTLSTGPTKESFGMEAIPDLGDQAYLYNSPAGAVDVFVDVFVKVGSYGLSVERVIEAGGTQATARSGALALAKALTAKLR